MTRISSYADWKAPGGDGELLIWPAPGELLRQTLANHASLSSATPAVQGVELRELRSRMRRELGLDDRPVIGMAHQTELYHCGVWAKLALMKAAAPAIGATLLHLAVDIDAPKHLNLRWPGWSQPITDDPAVHSRAWVGLLAAPTGDHTNDLQAMLQAAASAWPFEPLAGTFLSELQNAAKASAGGLSLAMTTAMNRLDHELGMGHRSMLLSPMLQSQPYLVLAHHLLANAEQFAAIYNAALASYRAAHRLRTAAKPMPDLRIADSGVEAPFWLDDLVAGTRARTYVQRDGSDWALTIGQRRCVLRKSADAWTSARQLGDFLRENRARISPRALTLTLFCRLLVMDQFVHGIGGGRYDQVTDQVIEKFFGIAAPAFAVTTATMLFPTAVGLSRPCLPCLAHEGHRLRHSLLGQEKMELVGRIQALPRGSAQRQSEFNQMHTQLAAKMLTHPAIKQWEQRVAQANRDESDQSPLFDREFFYAIQPRPRLQMLIDQYADQLKTA